MEQAKLVAIIVSSLSALLLGAIGFVAIVQYRRNWPTTAGILAVLSALETGVILFFVRALAR